MNKKTKKISSQIEWQLQETKNENYQQARVNMHTGTQPQRHKHDKSASSEGIIFLHAGLVCMQIPISLSVQVMHNKDIFLLPINCLKEPLDISPMPLIK
jgi:quercetin dioxygenase-like cupin family protein